jgi:predicted nucleotidyltransferase
MSLLETVAAERAQAIAGAVKAVDALCAIGVSALVTGSLARGTYGPGSDVDLIVTACPRHLKYAIEGLVEDCLAGLSFDVVYLDEIPPHKLSRFVDGAVRARDLR